MHAAVTADDLADVASRIREEGPLKVSHAARLVPADNRRGYVDAQVLVRWIVRGKRGVRLEGAQFSGKTWWTSKAALERFWGRLAAAELGKREGPAETPRERDRRAEAEDAELGALIGE